MGDDVRRLIAFACEGATLIGTVDEAPGTTGLLIVSGGNAVRCGAHRGMAQLAATLAAAGVPVFRFDRRGVGDSEGENRGYASAGPDIAAAGAAFRRAQPQVARLVAFGNCDAATALALGDHRFDSLILANPWLGDEQANQPAAAVRRHYRARWRDADAWRGFLRSSLSAKVTTLAAAVGRRKEQPLARRMASALRAGRATILLASRDRTAQVFAAAVDAPGRLTIDTASHSFADSGDALADAILAILADEAGAR